MNEREQIIDVVVSLLQNVSDFKKVTKHYKPFDLYHSYELPVACVLNGEESRSYQGQRFVAEFNVIVRVILYDEKNLTVKMNDLVNKVCEQIENNPYLDGKSVFPVEITRIEGSGGWLTPFEVFDVVMKTFYSKCLKNTL